MSKELANQPWDTIENDYYAYLLGVTPSANTPLNPVETESLGNIQALLTSVDDTDNSLPRLPEVLPKLMLALRNERASWMDIADIITQDASLVAAVLRLANSPLFHVTTQVNSLEQVVMQLGMVGLREVVITVSLKPIMKFEQHSDNLHLGRNIWTQAQSAAVACRSLAKTQPKYRYEAYLAGLVHNIGLVVVAHSLQESIKKSVPGSHIPHSMQFCAHIKDAAKQLSYLVAQHWGLPDVTLAALKEQTLSATVFESPLGSILDRGIQLSRLHELEREHVIKDSNPHFQALTDEERDACQQAYEQITTLV